MSSCTKNFIMYPLFKLLDTYLHSNQLEEIKKAIDIILKVEFVDNIYEALVVKKDPDLLIELLSLKDIYEFFKNKSIIKNTEKTIFDKEFEVYFCFCFYPRVKVRDYIIEILKDAKKELPKTLIVKKKSIKLMHMFLNYIIYLVTVLYIKRHDLYESILESMKLAKILRDISIDLTLKNKIQDTKQTKQEDMMSFESEKSTRECEESKEPEEYQESKEPEESEELEGSERNQESKESEESEGY